MPKCTFTSDSDDSDFMEEGDSDDAAFLSEDEDVEPVKNSCKSAAQGRSVERKTPMATSTILQRLRMFIAF
jgi:hypothetical protein